MSLPPPASIITLSTEPFAAAIQIVAVVTYPTPQQSQRAVKRLQTWHKQVAWAAERSRHPSGVRPARIEERLAALEERLRKRFEAARWALMLITKDGPVKLRFDGAPDPGVRALARWAYDGSESNVIRDVWSTTKPVLATMFAIRGQFDHTPTLAELCFNAGWVGPAIDAAKPIARWLDGVPELEYRASDRVEFDVPNLISGEPPSSA